MEKDSSEDKLANSKCYTVEEIIGKMGFGPFQVMISVFCGVLCLADAMELMILSVLSPAVKCQWSLSGFEEALITSIVFFGFFLGGLFWGVTFDYVGRKRGLLLVNIVLLIFGLLSAVKVSSEDSRLPGYPWLLACRFGVGFGAGGTSQSVAYYVEFLPQKTRGICVVLTSVWWSVGTMFGAALAIGVMGEDNLGWHWYLGLAAAPLAFTLLLFPMIPESARFYLIKGQDEKAKKVMATVAWYNCKKLPPIKKIVSYEDKERLKATVSCNEELVATVDPKTTSFSVTSDLDEDNTAEFIKKDSTVEAVPLLDSQHEDSAAQSKPAGLLVKGALLFNNGMWKTTVILLFLWFGVAWLYYGVVLLTTSLLQYNPHCGVGSALQFPNSSNASVEPLDCEGNQLDKKDYLKIMWTSAAELPGILVTLLIIEVLGRKVTLAVEFLATMIGFLLLFICTSDILITFFLFFTRAFTSGVFQVIYVYTPEVYCTSVRTLGMGICTSGARIGAILTPYVAQVLLRENDYATISLYAGSSLGLAVLAMLLPIETKGKVLKDKGH